ncbi:GNAT family N-acetyltransferase [Rossellomorea marisflavi]|uniref:GNAT family N-acetyltransferase n=1 Tax=Rossellomorea marisflavi TaxID=189381 RepID=UPI0034595440
MMRTERCSIERMTDKDIPSIRRLYADEDVRRYLGGVRTDLDFEGLMAVMGQQLHWAVRDLKDGTFLGGVSLSTHHNGQDTEVPYQFLPEHWGKGYAKEAVAAVLTHGFQKLELHRIVAETQVLNDRSCRLLENLGMRVEEEVERYGARQAIYALTKEEWLVSS